MKMGDIFHTNGVVRKEEWSNNGDRNNRVYGMHILWIWNFRFRTLISLFLQVFDCYLVTNSAGKVACKYPLHCRRHKQVAERLRLFQLLLKVMSVSYPSLIFV